MHTCVSVTMSTPTLYVCCSMWLGRDQLALHGDLQRKSDSLFGADVIFKYKCKNHGGCKNEEL